MAKSTARSELEKARYFLNQARQYEGRQGAAAMPYSANLEAAIVFSRRIMHLVEFEFRGKPDFKVWWNAQKTDLRNFIRGTRDSILKEGSLPLNRTYHIGVDGGVHGAVASGAALTQVVRANHWYKRHPKVLIEGVRRELSNRYKRWKRKRAGRRTGALAPTAHSSQSTPTQKHPPMTVHFTEPTTFDKKRAVEVIEDYLVDVEKVITEAETKWP